MYLFISAGPPPEHPASSMSGANKKPPVVLLNRTIGSFFGGVGPSTTQVTVRQSVGRPSSAPRLQPLLPDVDTRRDPDAPTAFKGFNPHMQSHIYTCLKCVL